MAKFKKVDDVYVNIDRIETVQCRYDNYKKNWGIWIETCGDMESLGNYDTMDECENAIKDLLDW